MAGGFRFGSITYSLKGKPKEEKTPIADYFVYVRKCGGAQKKRYGTSINNKKFVLFPLTLQRLRGSVEEQRDV